MRFNRGALFRPWDCFFLVEWVRMQHFSLFFLGTAEFPKQKAKTKRLPFSFFV